MVARAARVPIVLLLITSFVFTFLSFVQLTEGGFKRGISPWLALVGFVLFLAMRGGATFVLAALALKFFPDDPRDAIKDSMSPRAQ